MRRNRRQRPRGRVDSRRRRAAQIQRLDDRLKEINYRLLVGPAAPERLEPVVQGYGATVRVEVRFRINSQDYFALGEAAEPGVPRGVLPDPERASQDDEALDPLEGRAAGPLEAVADELGEEGLGSGEHRQEAGAETGDGEDSFADLSHRGQIQVEDLMRSRNSDSCSTGMPSFCASSSLLPASAPATT